MGQDGCVTELVLVHGLSGSSRWWRGLVPLLGERGVRLVDLPRFDRAFRPHQAAGWLAGELDRPAVLVGHSLGGLVCAQLAADRPELVRGLVLAAPAGAPRRRTLTAYAAGLARTIGTLTPDLFLTLARDALRAGPEALALGAFYAAGAQFEGAVQAPTLLVWGAGDRLIPIELAAEWQRAIPGAELRTIVGAAHVPMVETPSLFAELLLEFLHRIDDDARM
jgi:pimeloyl-ACP methyl ester carboxylesterase